MTVDLVKRPEQYGRSYFDSQISAQAQHQLRLRPDLEARIRTPQSWMQVKRLQAIARQRGFRTRTKRHSEHAWTVWIQYDPKHHAKQKEKGGASK